MKEPQESQKGDNEENNQPKSSNASATLLACGLSMGAIGTGAALITGVVCPICVVATPALLGGAAIMKIKQHLNRGSKHK